MVAIDVVPPGFYYTKHNKFQQFLPITEPLAKKLFHRPEKEH
jgi:hypothetical protein